MVGAFRVRFLRGFTQVSGREGGSGVEIYRGGCKLFRL